MAEEKNMVPGVKVGDRVRVGRNGQTPITGKVTRNDERAFEMERDDIPPHKEYTNPGGCISTVQVTEHPYTAMLFGGNDERDLKANQIRVEKIA